MDTTPIWARDDCPAECPTQERNEEWRCFHSIPFGLQPKRYARRGKAGQGGSCGHVLRLAHGLFDLQRILEN